MTIKRSKPLPRQSKPIARKTRVRPVNAKRRKANHARAYGGQARIWLVQSRPCVLADHMFAFCNGPIEQAHTKGGGAGRKADAAWVVPMCRLHHRQLHETGKATFEATHKINLDQAAARLELLWQRCTDEKAALADVL